MKYIYPSNNKIELKPHVLYDKKQSSLIDVYKNDVLEGVISYSELLDFAKSMGKA